MRDGNRPIEVHAFVPFLKHAMAPGVPLSRDCCNRSVRTSTFMQSLIIRALGLALVCLLAPTQAPGYSYRLIRSLAGPTGTVVGSKFVFDETRNRFVYPADKEFRVYFEWQAEPGMHTLSAVWKNPEGRVVQISSDVKIETKSTELTAYWIYAIDPAAPSGVWTVEVRINGQPAGSHSFELILPEPPKPQPVVTPVAQPPTLDEIYRSATPSLVWVHRLDPSLRRVDSSSGFVIGAGRVATAFQAIDGAVALEIEFNDGRKVMTNEIWACHRAADWAIVKADTQNVPPLVLGDPKDVAIGQRFIIFNIEGARARMLGGVDFAARENVPGFGERLRITPSPTAESMGGPLLDASGRVVGILGGSCAPGARSSRVGSWISPGLWTRVDVHNGATPITALTKPPYSPSTLETLTQQRVLTPPFQPVPYLTYCGTTRTLPKALNLLMQDSFEFSRADPQLFVYTMWQKKDKTSKVLFSARVYDAINRSLVEIEPKKVSLMENAPSVAWFSLVPDSLGLGTFRVDILINGLPVSRTFFQVVE